MPPPRPLALLLLTAALLTPTKSHLQCDQVDKTKCMCYNAEHIEIQCPRVPGGYGQEITLTLTRQGSVSVQCMQPYLDLDLLPNLNLSSYQTLQLEYCYLNNSFSEIAARLNMLNVTSLGYELVAADDKDLNLTLGKEDLAEMPDLETLSLTDCNLFYDPEFLAQTPNLLRLVLYKDKIGDFDVNLEHVPRLKVLDLSRNHVTNLREGVFDPVQNLTILYLYNNNLSSLSRHLFRNLTKLKILELSYNQISDLPEDTFADLSSLVDVSLRGNKISKVPKGLFRNNLLVENIRLDLNPNIILAEDMFANLSKLQSINLQLNNMTSIPENLFHNIKSLRAIYLQSNRLQMLSERLFEGLSDLKVLDLSRNALTDLPDDIFSSLTNLRELNLGFNKLVEIRYDLLKNVDKLERLDLRNNSIAVIESMAFVSVKNSLLYLDLSYNEWDNAVMFNADYSPLNMLLKIEELDLKHNRIREYYPRLYQMLKLKRIDLSFNRIENPEIINLAHYRNAPLEIDLSYNHIEMVIPYDSFINHLQLLQTPVEDDDNNEVIDYDDSNKVRVILQGNPIACDCTNYNLVRYNRGDFMKFKSLVEIDQDGLFCNGTNTPVMDLKPDEVECVVEAPCPDKCNCAFKPLYTALVVNCSHKGLQAYPRVDFGGPTRSNQTFLYLDGNNFTRGPVDLLYENVTVLDLSNNSIRNVSWVPPKIMVLNLNYNKLTTLDPHFVDKLRNLTSLKSIRLKGNPWECSCQLSSLQNFIFKYYHKVNASDIYCENKQQELAKVIPLCKSSPYLTMLLPAILVILLCFSISFALYYRYQTEINIFLYSKNLFRWLFTEEDLDPTKEFDVFVSFSNKDLNFVAKLVDELENGHDLKFRVCHHAKHFVAGDTIMTNIERSVEKSRRTIIVLSNNFLESQWAPLEFILAHMKAMHDANTNVIVILYGDVDVTKCKENPNLKELSSYLETNTYLKWDDKFFWSRLKYALPHKKRGFYEENRKHNELMLKIDDKFCLAKEPPSPTNTSTPPIIMSLDPSLLEKKWMEEGEDPLLNKGFCGTEVC